MLDDPTNNSATATATTVVSMFQTNSVALKVSRAINWAATTDSCRFVAESSDGAAILLMTSGDGSPAFLLICDPANLAASETAH